jgi:hypothetical protein
LANCTNIGVRQKNTGSLNQHCGEQTNKYWKIALFMLVLKKRTDLGFLSTYFEVMHHLDFTARNLNRRGEKMDEATFGGGDQDFLGQNDLTGACG